jgi:ubiquinone/menaquinone biosynthesis C-methylase UbiE
VAANPFENPVLAARYESWYAGRGRRADRRQRRLLADLLGDLAPGRTALDVGCGTGHFTRWLAGRGYRVTGLDLSPAMLAEADGAGVHYVVADALDLPFADRSFDTVALITVLEFVADPFRALAEAVRVARGGVLVGALNRSSRLARRRRASAEPPWDAARFFLPSELTRLVRAAAGGRLERVRRRTALPWGAFIGLSARLRRR